jgi:hypothetical protein
MTVNALLLNTVSTEPIDLLETDPSIRLTVLTHPEYAHYYRHDTDVVLTDDVTDLCRVRDVVVDLMRTRPISHVIAPSERGLQGSGFLRSFLGLPGTGYETSNLFSNKLAMKRRLAEAGLPVAPFTALGSLADLPARAAELGWPVVVKPVLGAAARDTHVVTGPAAFAELMAAPHAAGLRTSRYPLILERFVDVEAELHCDGIVSGGTVRFDPVSRYVLPPLRRREHISGSYTLPGNSADVRPVRELHQAVVAAFGLRDGITHLEVLRTPDGYLIGEISCRPGGSGIGDMLRLRYGVDIWQALVDVSVGREPRCAPVDTGGVVVMAMLPASPGRVEQVTSAAELAAMPGVLDVQRLMEPGSVVSGERSSIICAGLVYLRVPDEAAVAPRLADLDRAFTLRVGTAERAA